MIHSQTLAEGKPIHLSGSIQPHGMLLALAQPALGQRIAPTALEILHLSTNTQDYLGKEPEELLGQPLSTLLDAKQIEALLQILALGEGSVNALKLTIPTQEGDRDFDGIVHRTEEAIILELEPTDTLAESRALSFYALARGAIGKMRSCYSAAEFLEIAVRETQKLSGFDRVMLYQFAPDGSGCVVAEAKREDLSPYLGLHFPAIDVPEAAKELYSRCWLRIVPDVSAPPVPLVPVEPPLDLSFSALRSVDRCFVEYLQNMGVAATLVVSLVRDRQLWGLISCHHQTPKPISWEMRTACEFLGQFIALELSHFIDREESDYLVKLQSLRSQVIESIAGTDNLTDALIQPVPRLLDIAGAAGAAVCLDRDITLVGDTPGIEEIRALIEWADPQIDDCLFCTAELPRLYPEAIAFKNAASGLLLLRISQMRRYYILWFRPEVIQTVNWAGDPSELIKLEADGSMTLCPRNSFALWQETVRSTSLPWKRCELDSALDIRNAIVGIVLAKAEELAKLNQELERSNRELASFAFAASHDLKEPLRGIYNYSTIVLEDYASVLDEDGIDCLETVRSLSMRMETLVNALLRLSRLGQEELHLQATDLNELLDRVIEVFHASRPHSQLDIRLPRSLSMVQCDPVLTNEIFSNLLSNAFKYNDKAEPWVEIGYLDGDEPTVFYVRDNGIGIQADYLEIVFKLFKRLHAQSKYGGGAGAGLAIARKIVERHGGRIWVESTYGEGSTFYFTLK
jgi:light-regulated signal transduction histidine kinase (bacteriophytochrome)